MALTLADIQAPIASELEAFEVKFREAMRSNVFLLDKVMYYIVKRKGKQIRPMFVFLTAYAAGGVTEATYRGAALIELLHTASLVHDDVVDDAAYRRGFFSVNALWKNKIAVLGGDYLLSRGLLLSVKNKDYDLLEIVSDAVRQMSEGELLQMEKARRLDITESVYYDIIKQKTASLLSSCCAVGARSAGAPQALIDIAAKFGELIGIAFQIKDDLFDYGSEEIGKPLGIDIKEKKMTLPLIHSLSKADWLTKRRIISIVKNHSEKPKKVAEVIAFVKESGGLEYAEIAMKSYIDQAFGLLSCFPDTPYRKSLADLVSFTIERNK